MQLGQMLNVMARYSEKITKIIKDTGIRGLIRRINNWKNRVKGRDWYDLVWYAANHPHLNLAHLEQRMRQTGQWSGEKSLSLVAFTDLLFEAIDRLDVNQARKDVAPVFKDQQMLALWSHDFFQDVASRIQAEG